MLYGKRVRFRSAYEDFGDTRKVSVTLTESDWAIIDDWIKEGKYRSRSDYFRRLHNEELRRQRK